MLAKKSLGQNFLTNKNKIKEIVESLELKDGDVVIEIGPGHGELTEELAKSEERKAKSKEEKGIKIIAIEKDEELAKDLKIKFQNNNNIEIIGGDALEILLNFTEKLKNLKTYKLAGNIPYYITGYLFRILGEFENKPEIIVLTIQKEVAERVCAEPPKMNLLAASVQFWAKTEIVSYISKKDFDPIPKVDSAIIKLKVESDPSAGGVKSRIEEENYYHFIKILFKQPRKTILNNLEFGFQNKEEISKKLEEAGIKPSDRAQNLNVGQILELSKIFK